MSLTAYTGIACLTARIWVVGEASGLYRRYTAGSLVIYTRKHVEPSGSISDREY